MKDEITGISMWDKKSDNLCHKEISSKYMFVREGRAGFGVFLPEPQSVK